MSYFDVYYNLRGERTLRGYSRPVNLARFDRLCWMTSDQPLWYIAEHLAGIPHTRLLPRSLEKALTRLDRRAYQAGLTGYRPHR